MKKLLRLTLTAIVLSSLTSCVKNDDKPNEPDFDVPELTLANTIQFTADTRSRSSVEFGISGSLMAVDWGDGTISTGEDPRTGDYIDSHNFSHTYKKSGEYRIKIWSEHLINIRLSGLLRDYGDLHVGDCPVLKTAVFNSLSSGSTVNLNGCPQLQELELSNWKQFESVTLDKCTELKIIYIYTNPNMSPLDLSQNTKLSSAYFWYCAVDVEKLPKGIVHLECNNNGQDNLNLENFKELTTLDCSHNAALTTLNIKGCDKLSNLDFSNTGVRSFDFAECPELAAVSCSSSALTAVNVGENPKLMALYCSNLDLDALSVANNPALGILDCGGNKLTALDVSANKYLHKLYINDNLLNDAELETIFEALPSYEQLPYSLWPMQIKIWGNPGTAVCDDTIVTNKGWLIRENN